MTCKKKVASQINGRPHKREYCLLITFNVKNVFNSAPWQGISNRGSRKTTQKTLFNKNSKSILKDRDLMVDEQETMDITCGVSQGSVLGPTLWNLYYDEVLKIRVPKQVTSVGYANDLSVVITGNTSKELRDNKQNK